MMEMLEDTINRDRIATTYQSIGPYNRSSDFNHLAAHRIEILAGGGLRCDGIGKGSEDSLAVNDGLIGE